MTATELAALLLQHPDARVRVDGCCGGGCAPQAVAVTVHADGDVEIRHEDSLPLPEGTATQ